MIQDIRNNLKIVYCSHSILDQEQEPDWVASCAEDPLFRDAGFCFYRPAKSLAEHFVDNPFFLSLQHTPPNEKLKQHATFLKMNDVVFSSMDKAGPMLNATDVPLPMNQNILKDMYCLVRSSIILCDCRQASFGENMAELMLASFGDIPSISLTDRYVNSPWVFNYSTMLAQVLEKKKLLKLMIGLVKE